jgi:hypothetical protein
MFRFSTAEFHAERVHDVGLSFFFLIGAACPILLWFLTRRYPNTILNYLK